jgi:hypothetical protein
MVYDTLIQRLVGLQLGALLSGAVIVEPGRRPGLPVARSTIASEPPLMAVVPHATTSVPPRTERRARTAYRLARSSFKLAFAVVIGLGVLAGAAVPALLAPHDPIEQSLVNRLRPPMWLSRGQPEHPLGTDGLGRDLLSRVIHDAHTTFVVALTSSLIGGAVGAAVGLVAGSRGGMIDVRTASAMTRALSPASVKSTMRIPTRRAQNSPVITVSAHPARASRFSLSRDGGGAEPRQILWRGSPSLRE